VRVLPTLLALLACACGARQPEQPEPAAPALVCSPSFASCVANPTAQVTCTAGVCSCTLILSGYGAANAGITVGCQVATPPAPPVLTIDETLDAWDVAAAEQVAAEWCSFDSSLCLPTRVGPVAPGQLSSIRRLPAGCPELGHTTAAGGQVELFTACNDARYHLTHGMVLSHELGHFWGAGHVGPNNTMSGEPRELARCITYTDLAEVCSHHDCAAPRFDLVCTDAEAFASNPYNSLATL
jgi:hypothetical protein